MGAMRVYRSLALFLIFLFALGGFAGPNGAVLVCHRTGQVTPLVISGEPASPAHERKVDDCCAEENDTGTAMLIQAHCCDLRPGISRATGVLPVVTAPTFAVMWQPVAAVVLVAPQGGAPSAPTGAASAGPRAPPDLTPAAPRGPPSFC